MDGTFVGMLVGHLLGVNEGTILGPSVGFSVGTFVGISEGVLLGVLVGVEEGKILGEEDSEAIEVFGPPFMYFEKAFLPSLLDLINKEMPPLIILSW